MFPPISRPLLALAACVLLASDLPAQGSDDCATPLAIAGTGAFAFDTSGATTSPEGQGFGLCASYGTSAIGSDVWFAWTAAQDGLVALRTCGLTGIDTKVAVYAGSGCPGSPPVGCNDDACTYQSEALFLAIAGSTYAIQIGSFPGAAGGAGAFSIDPVAQFPTCTSGVGPDVVLGEVTNVFNAPAEGAIDAIAIGGTACNVGTSPIDWNGSVGASPAIRQNLFRYSVVGGAGRFEQVGMSWLKHGFFAVQESYCCQCAAEPGNGKLGVGCADTYVAGINAAQQFLTPNWEVNGHTGSFPHPASNPPWSGNVARRLQVELADLEVTGTSSRTRYFVEGLYVARDDALAGNQDNNASYREMFVAGGPTDFDLGIAGGSRTERGQAAIRAWRKIDPGVRYAEVRVPGDGVLILCWRVTQVAFGKWRYEYALYNQSCDRSVGAFSIPVPAGVSVSNVGFHGARYHSGDGPGDVDFSAVDWPAVPTGAALTWRTETPAQNPRANAVRWGTLYNFRFDATRPPRSATATIGLWKPGVPARVSTAVQAPM